MSVEVKIVNSIDDLDKYFEGGVYEVEELKHELRFFHRKGIPTLKVHEESAGPALFESINEGIKKMQSRLKPQHKKAPLWVGVFTGPNMPEDMIIRVGVRSVIKGLATTEELFIPEGFH